MAQHEKVKNLVGNSCVCCVGSNAKRTEICLHVSDMAVKS